jgi:hypothetical protein
VPTQQSVLRREAGRKPARTLTTKVVRLTMAKMLVAAPVWIVTGADVSDHAQLAASDARTPHDPRDEVIREPKACLSFSLCNMSARPVRAPAPTHEVETEHDGDDDIRECSTCESDDDHRLELVELHEWANDPALDGRGNPQDCTCAGKQRGGRCDCEMRPTKRNSCAGGDDHSEKDAAGEELDPPCEEELDHPRNDPLYGGLANREKLGVTGADRHGRVCGAMVSSGG